MRPSLAPPLGRRASAKSSASQPPIDEPMTIWRPRVWSKTASDSSSQREMVPSSKRPLERPWPE